MAALASENKLKLRWLVADLNSYFASCEQQEDPRLRGKPVAVAPLIADTTCAIAASQQAKLFGVKTGTKIADAWRMCPDLILVQSRPKLYVEYHHRILHAIESCIPIDLITPERQPALAGSMAWAGLPEPRWRDAGSSRQGRICG